MSGKLFRRGGGGGGEAWGNRKLSVICTISRLTIRRQAPDQCQECGKNNPESEARAHLRCGCSCDADLMLITMTRVAIKKGDCSHYDKGGGEVTGARREVRGKACNQFWGKPRKPSRRTAQRATITNSIDVAADDEITDLAGGHHRRQTRQIP